MMSGEGERTLRRIRSSRKWATPAAAPTSRDSTTIWAFNRRLGFGGPGVSILRI
jgi:hypothetical protein